MTHYTASWQGIVESCRAREHGYVIGVRTQPYLVEHFAHPDALKIGSSVRIHHRAHHHPEYTLELLPTISDKDPRVME